VSFNTEYFRVPSITELGGRARIPSSKPETQRAVIAATLTRGSSRIYNDLRCSEADTMKAACRAVGAGIHEHDGFLEVHGMLQKEGLVTHVVARKLVDRTQMLGTLVTQSRDFR